MTSSSSNSRVNEDISHQDITNPLIFFCSGCRTIVGDSYAFVTSNESQKTITLSAASSIVRSTVVHTSKHGFDIGSTYFTFNCANCSQTLGKYYITTSADLDNIRTKFTFMVEYLSTYELGKPSFGKLDEREIIEFASDEQSKRPDRNDTTSTESLHSMQNDLIKMKHLINIHDERIIVLEQELSNITKTGYVKQSTVAQFTNMSWYGANGVPLDSINSPYKRNRLDS